MKNYDYAIIGNCTSSALISSDCSIDWLCLPFFDSPSVFAKILDEEKGGIFKIEAVDLIRTEQSYITNTPILKTSFYTEQGIFEVRDYMPRFLTSNQEYYCPPEIHREIRVVAGAPKMVIRFHPKPNYAASESVFALENSHLKVTSQKGEYASFYLYSNLDYNSILKSEPIELKGDSFFNSIKPSPEADSGARR